MIAMRTLAVVSLVLLAATCGPDPNAKLPSFVASSGGGENGVGGTSESGGTVGAGGASGQTGSGGRGTGGAVGTGGKSGSGGSVASGGSAGSTSRDAGSRSGGSGGRGEGGTGGSDGRIGGRSGSGGDTGGRRDDASTTRDAPISSPDTCVAQVVSNDYACGSATSCADCKDNNNNPRTDGCKKAIDCLAKSGCDTNCQKNCLNLAGDQYGIACVTALQTAACSGSGCGATTPPNRGG